MHKASRYILCDALASRGDYANTNTGLNIHHNLNYQGCGVSWRQLCLHKHVQLKDDWLMTDQAFVFRQLLSLRSLFLVIWPIQRGLA